MHDPPKKMARAGSQISKVNKRVDKDYLRNYYCYQ
jgi:hypothetical protein